MTSQIWFDLDNSPHVPLFRPIFKRLDNQKKRYLITARDFAQTQSLLEYWNIDHLMVGKHGGKNKVAKIANLFVRSMQLRSAVKRNDISLAVSHGSRTQLLTAWSLSIPSILMLDYEYTESRIFNRFSDYLLIPEYIPMDLLKRLDFDTAKVIQYPGFKEDIYLYDFIPDSGFRQTIGVSDDEILVSLRPPSIVGNYHNVASEDLFVRTLNHVTAQPNIHCLILSRVRQDAALVPQKILDRGNIHFLNKSVDGLQLLWNSDLVISGGGTMNRESALLGVPTYSIFKGAKPYLDFYLENQKKIIFIQDPDHVKDILIKKRSIDPTADLVHRNNRVIDFVVNVFLDIERRKMKK